MQARLTEATVGVMVQSFYNESAEAHLVLLPTLTRPQSDVLGRQ